MTTTTRNEITMDDAAKILGVRAGRAAARLRALGYATKCHRCIRGFVANGIGGNRCWTCGGTGERIAVTEAQAREAAARVEAGELVGYFAQNAAFKDGAARCSATHLGEMVVALFEAIRDAATRTPAAPRHRAKVSAIREWNELPRAQRGGIVQNADGTWSVTRVA